MNNGKRRRAAKLARLTEATLAKFINQRRRTARNVERIAQSQVRKA